MNPDCISKSFALQDASCKIQANLTLNAQTQLTKCGKYGKYKLALKIKMKSLYYSDDHIPAEIWAEMTTTNYEKVFEEAQAIIQKKLVELDEALKELRVHQVEIVGS